MRRSTLAMMSGLGAMFLFFVMMVTPAGTSAQVHDKEQVIAVLLEQEAKVGGLLSTSIPPFRFDHAQLQWELDMILATGIDVRTNTKVGTGADEADMARKTGVGGGAAKPPALMLRMPLKRRCAASASAVAWDSASFMAAARALA